MSDDSPVAGASFTFSATVRNAGRGNAAATTLRVYRSDDETIIPSDEEVGAATVAELAASARGGASVKVTAPASPGTHHYGACADPVAGESGTANNCSATVRVVVQVQVLEPASPRPDLVVESPSVSDDVVAAGASVTFSATVRNAGDGEAAATTLRVYRSEDATITAFDQEVDAVTVPELAALESTVASAKLSAPSSSGTYYYGACVHVVAEESDTANNCSAAVTVTVHRPQIPAHRPQVPVSRPPQPDLEANLLRVYPRSPPIGGLFKLTAEVRNRGAATTMEWTTLRFYLSTDATITQSDTELDDWRVGRLPTDSSLVVYPRLKAPSSKGTYYYGACVDAVAGESAAANNCSAAMKLDVSKDEPDLHVSRWSHDRSRPSGRRLLFVVAVWNDGSPSDATTLRLLVLPDQMSEPSAGTQVGEVAVPELAMTRAWPATSVRSVQYQAPATAGVYHYVMCVDAVPRESDTKNNCSATVAVKYH